jgi:hypothetical protein
MSDLRRTNAMELLHRTEARYVEHLSGTLLEHLVRTEELLRQWGASDEVAIAGLCHAVYGTDGFPVALLNLDSRNLVVDAVGSDTEAIIYLYASCDRGSTYPNLLDGGSHRFADRFVGGVVEPTLSQLQNFVDLSLANEADVLLGPGRSGPVSVWLQTFYGDLGYLASDSVRLGFERYLEAAMSPQGGTPG